MVGAYVLMPLGKDRFYSIQDYTEVRALRDEEGRVTQIDWNGTTMRRVGR